MNSELTKTRQLSRLLPPRDDTLGLWRFRNDLSDSSGYDHDLTAVAIGSYISGGLTENVLTAIAPTGPAGAAAKIVAASATDFDMGAGDFTVEIIAYTTETSGMFMLSKNDGGSPLTGFYIGAGANLFAYKIGDGSNEVSGVSSAAVNDGRWHHFAIVFDRTNDQVCFYIDGMEDSGSPDNLASVTGSISAASNDFEVGKWWNGGIDEIAFHKHALSAAEIAARAAGRLAPFVRVTPGELKGYLRGIDDAPIVDEVLLPFEYPFAALRQKAREITDLVKLDQVPERHLPALASLFNFELPDATLLSLRKRRIMFKWITWLYQHKGTHACAQKLIDLAGLTATTIDRYPDNVAFILNGSRIFGYVLVPQTFFIEDFAGNLSQWDPPLDSSLPWRLQNEALYCKVGALMDYDSAILFDDSEKSFYIQADVKMIANPDVPFGFYLAYQDSNNWLRLAKEPAVGNAKWMLRWSDAGVTGYAYIGSTWGDFWDTYSAGDTIKIWIHADLDKKVYTAGADDHTCAFEVTPSHPDITGSKKGLWLGYNAELEWDNVSVKSMRAQINAVLFDEDARLGRGLRLNYSGTSRSSQAKKAYVAAVLPRYVPLGVVLEWIRDIPVASRIGFRTGNITVVSGWVLNGDRAARIGFRTGGITPIKGSLVRTPDASRFGLRTSISEVVKVPGAIRIGFRTGDITKIKQYIPVEGHINNLDTDRENEAFGGDSRPYLIDSDYDTPMPFEPSDDCSIGLEFAESKNIDIIILYDSYTSEPDGLYSSGNNKLKVYSGSSDSPYVLEETFATLTRTGRKIVLSLATTITAKWIKVFPHDGKLRSSNGEALFYSEIEAYQN